MKRRLLNLLTLLSALLCMTLAALRVRAMIAGNFSIPIREAEGGAYVARFSPRSTNVIWVATVDRRAFVTAASAKSPPRPARIILDVPHLLLTTVFGVLPCLRLGRWFRRLAATHGVCPACGYDLRATPDRCPECGYTRATNT